MCICLSNGIFLERGIKKKRFENKGIIFMVRMYRAKSLNSQFGGTDHLDTMEGTEQLTKYIDFIFPFFALNRVCPAFSWFQTLERSTGFITIATSTLSSVHRHSCLHICVLMNTSTREYGPQNHCYRTYAVFSEQ